MSFSLLVYGLLAFIVPDYGQLSDLVSTKRLSFVHPFSCVAG